MPFPRGNKNRLWETAKPRGAERCGATERCFLQGCQTWALRGVQTAVLCRVCPWGLCRITSAHMRISVSVSTGSPAKAVQEQPARPRTAHVSHGHADNSNSEASRRGRALTSRE